MKPYYHDERAGITIYCGDCRDLLPELRAQDVDLLIADPPYGVNERTDRNSKGRGGGKAQWPSRDWEPIAGDDEEFDPQHLLRFKRLVLFGANYYAHHLPPASGWVFWDKRDGSTPDDNADGELAWTNLGGPLRVFRHCWRGFARASESGERPLHPTQKPVALMKWLIEWRTGAGDLVLDPYCGCGPVLRAAKDLGRSCIGIEIEERYAEIAANRLSQEVLTFA